MGQGHPLCTLRSALKPSLYPSHALSHAVVSGEAVSGGGGWEQGREGERRREPGLEEAGSEAGGTWGVQAATTGGSSDLISEHHRFCVTQPGTAVPPGKKLPLKEEEGAEVSGCPQACQSSPSL